MLDFKLVFGVPREHSLRLARAAPCGGASEVREWEHEEYDRNGVLVAVYESWLRGNGDLAYIQYSPFGWVLSVSGRIVRRLPPKPRARMIMSA